MSEQSKTDSNDAWNIVIFTILVISIALSFTGNVAAAIVFAVLYHKGPA